MLLGQAPLFFALADCLIDKPRFVDRADSGSPSTATGVNGVAAHPRMGLTAAYRDDEAHRAWSHSHYSERDRWRWWLSDDCAVSSVTAFDARCGPQVVLHRLFPDDGFEDQVALKPDPSLIQHE